MNQRQSLAVIIPNYNHGKHLIELLPSILSQSRPPDEIIVVDDGSTDDSVSMITEIAKKHPSLKLYRNVKNQGVVFTLNRAIDLAQSDYLTFPSADNFVLPNMYEKSMKILEQYPHAGLCCSDPMYYDEATKKTTQHSLGISKEPRYFSPEEVIRLTQKGLCVGNICHTVVVKRKAMEEVALDGHYYIPQLKWHCDFFTMNAVSFCHGICYIPEKLAMFRNDSNSYSQKRHAWQTRKEVYQQMIEVLNLPRYSKVKPLFKRSSVLSEFTYSMLGSILLKPAFYEFLTFFYLRRAVPPTLRWMTRGVAARIPFALETFRFLKRAFKRRTLTKSNL